MAGLGESQETYPKLPSTCPQKHTQRILLKENIEKEFE
jgi:hypothetical protein